MKNFISVLVLAAIIVLSTAANAEKIIINIDGTNNQPEDGIDRHDRDFLDYIRETKEIIKDESISNVLKAHLFFGGSIPNSMESTNGQISLYYVGVGNHEQYDSVLERIDGKLEAAIAKDDPDKIHGRIISDLASIYKENDELYIFGFSRGAAIARRLAQRLDKNGLTLSSDIIISKPEITFLGVWDTVSSFGIPNANGSVPDSTDIEEVNGKIASNIIQAYHLVAIDELRNTFQPTLMQLEPKVTEIWFPGVHSDVGGGYLNDGLSDIALEFMLERAEEIAKLSVLDLEDEEDCNSIKLKLGEIEIDRLKIVPDIKAKLHRPEQFKPSSLVGFRNIKVSGSDTTDKKPLIHPSVLKRRDELGVENLGENLQKLLESKENYEVYSWTSPSEYSETQIACD